ncbi:MAG TPA: DUF5054 domain-containing protein [Devosiaceae bacterium]|jgi:hypothetical protein
MTDKVIHLIFKTHLDIGFTDHAAKVRAQYHERFIPQAIETGAHFFRENPERPRFIWTTGAWLIWDHLNNQPREEVARLEQAIERGVIAWHALPFTTHTELMSPALFRAGLSYAQELDARFGKRTIASKMTDVPGHTLGMVPLLAEAGVKFLHIGVNTASPPPAVPDVFRWRAPSGAEVVVMYQKSYGATHFPEAFSEGLSFAHTSDNIGPQSVPQTNEAYRELHAANPDAEIVASTLDAYGELLWARRADFPVVDIELGDSWIHGSASDPIKTARFTALRRLYDAFAEDNLTPERLAFGRDLAMVAEHTCGVDIKSYLRDETSWDRPAFEAARQADYRFAYTEESWAEQRAYLDAAVSQLGYADRARARDALAEMMIEPKTIALEAVRGDSLDVGGWSISFDGTTGDLIALTTPAGRHLRGASHGLLGYRYESYDAADMAAHMDSYLTHRAEWAILDHDKPGLKHAHTARSANWVSGLSGIHRTEDFAVLRLSMRETAVAQLGAPAHVDLALRPLDAERIEIAVILYDKPANRMPEASFVSLTPRDASNWQFHKLGLWQPGDRVAQNGGGQLQAVSDVSAEIEGMGMLTVTPLDTPLVAPAGSPFMPFNKAAPDLSDGIRFNLHNNKWGTNFPMWWEGTLKARFTLTLK